MANQNHIPVIVSLRGLAASAVCFYHFVCTTTGFINNKSILLIFDYGKYGISLFFIISGIVIPISMINGDYSLKKWRQFMVKRVVRIEPPYLIAVMVGIAYLYIRNFVPGSAPLDLTPTLFNIILHVGYLIPFFENQDWINPVFWTLAIEFQYYLTISLLLPMAVNKNFFFRILFYLLFLSFSFFNNQTQFFPAWGAYFLFGIIYALFFIKKINVYEYLIVAAFCMTVIIYQLGITNGLIALITVSIIHFFKSHSSGIGDFIGNISYSLYLLHSIIGAAFVNFFSHRADESWEKILIIISGYLISLFSAYLMYRIIELPSQKYSRKFYS